MGKDAMALIVPLSHGDSDVSIKMLKPGDTLVIKNINGLEYGDSTLPEIEHTEPIEVSLYHADMTTANQPTSRYNMGLMVAGAVQQILAQMGHAESIERKAVQAKAINEAKAKGIRFGRPSVETPENFGEIVAQWESGSLSIHEALEQTGFKQTTFYKRLKEHRSNK